MSIHAMFSTQELVVLRKPDRDGFVLVRRVKDKYTQYVRLTDLREERVGEIKAAMDEAPPWDV